jgi:hypothetical protein
MFFMAAALLTEGGSRARVRDESGAAVPMHREVVAVLGP